MPYVIELGNEVVGTLGLDGKVSYDEASIRRVTEMVAGQPTTGKGGFVMTQVRVSYKFDKNRKSNNDAIYLLWKENPILKSRVRQLNSLIFGRGFTYSYDQATKDVIDRFWRINRLRAKLNPMGTDAQLFGEVFIGMIPQQNGDVLAAIYESNQVEVDFNPASVDDIRQYIVGYKDEEKGVDTQLKFKPLYVHLNEQEIQTKTTMGKVVRKVQAMLGNTGLSGFDGVMIHIKFNNSSTEVHGTSDFRQVYKTLNDYMDFRADRLAIQQIFGSPSYDITIDTDDPAVIQARISELMGFTIGSNPVHNKSEEWKPLEFRHEAGSVEYDEKAMRGMICAGLGFPEHMLFNQGDGSDDSTFALNKLAEDMQDAFGDAFTDIHKYVISVAGGDMSVVDQGQIIFPEISTMSEKAKAETYVLKVGANICSRKTAALNTGHNWDIEEPQILDEMDMFGLSTDNPDTAGVMGGRFSSKANNQDPNRDDGSDDRKARGNARNISTQTFGSRKTNN